MVCTIAEYTFIVRTMPYTTDENRLWVLKGIMKTLLNRVFSTRVINTPIVPVTFP